MDTKELERLARWYIDEYPNLARQYQEVLNPIQHNATQPNKQTLEEPLNKLLEYLRNISFDHLSLQQLRQLANLQVDRYVGREGGQFVERTIRTAEYDPSTAASKLAQALATLGLAHSGFTQYLAALSALTSSSFGSYDDENDKILIRVEFQHGASINNVADWKESAKDWYDIIRGLAMAANEAPEDTKVIGAENGSIILILVGTVTVTSLLALISKHVITAATQVVGLQNQILRIYDLRNGLTVPSRPNLKSK